CVQGSHDGVPSFSSGTNEHPTRPQVGGENVQGKPLPPAPGGYNKYALLVGCSYYDHLPEHLHLWGPEHDVPMLANLLTKTFGFPEDNVRSLVGWPVDEKARPTRRNIEEAFQALIAKAGAGCQVVIYLSGHGTQVPIPKEQTDVNDPRNPEPDGLDEV